MGEAEVMMMRHEDTGAARIERSAGAATTQDFVLVDYGAGFHEVLDARGGRLAPEESPDREDGILRLLALPLAPGLRIEVHPRDDLWRRWAFLVGVPEESRVPVVLSGARGVEGYAAATSLVGPEGFTTRAARDEAGDDPRVASSFHRRHIPPPGAAEGLLSVGHAVPRWPGVPAAPAAPAAGRGALVYPAGYGSVNHFLTPGGDLDYVVRREGTVAAPLGPAGRALPVAPREFGFEFPARYYGSDGAGEDWEADVLGEVVVGWTAYPIAVDGELVMYGVSTPVYAVGVEGTDDGDP